MWGHCQLRVNCYKSEANSQGKNKGGVSYSRMLGSACLFLDICHGKHIAYLVDLPLGFLLENWEDFPIVLL